MKDTVIFDLDGTLADGRHRLHLLPKKDHHLTEAWVEFNLEADKDKPFEDNIGLLISLYYVGYNIVILTGRSDIAKDLTVKWLEDNGVPYHQLVMRKQADNRKDTVIKEEFLREYGLDRVLCCFDDLPQVANHFREMGLTCHLVTEYKEDRDDLKSHGVDE